MSTGESLRIALIKRGRKQSWLANKLGIKRQHVSAWCRGQGVRPETLSKILELLEYKTSEFYALSE